MTVSRIGPAEAHAKMKGEAFTYVDVRTPEEFAEGRPAGAVNVPFSLRDASGSFTPNPDFLAAMEGRFAKDAGLVIGCKGGGRSARAAAALETAGFTKLLDQTAGWDGKRGSFGELTEPGWSRVDLPTDR